MKTSQWILIIGAIFFTTLGFILMGYYFNWWILGGWGIFMVIFIFGFLIFKWRSNISEIKEKEESKVLKKQNIDKDECLELFRLELEKPYYADMIDIVYFNKTLKIGTDEITPINIIKLTGKHEDSVEYYQITNMSNPKERTILMYDNSQDKEEFKKELKESINSIADRPEKEEEISDEPIINPATGMPTGATRRRIKRVSKAEKKKKEEEEKEEEAEGL